jgi:acyl transferase domain-containing protein
MSSLHTSVLPRLRSEYSIQIEPLTPDFAAPDGKWVASVSCHGIGGSNAHVVLETLESSLVSPPAMQMETGTSLFNPIYLFIFSGTTEPAIIRWKDSLTVAYNDIADNRVLRSLSYELARLSRPRPARAFAIGPKFSPGLALSKPVMINPKINPKLCLVFAGQGPQHIFMGKGLSSTFPAFVQSVRRSDEILVQVYGKVSFLEHSGLFLSGVKPKLSEDGVWLVQDVVFSIVFVQLALVDLLKSLGVEYDCVVGHRYEFPPILENHSPHCSCFKSRRSGHGLCGWLLYQRDCHWRCHCSRRGDEES